MKKILFLLALGCISVASAQSAYEQLEDTAYYGNEAVHNSSDEGAREQAGCGFDYPCSEPTPVYLPNGNGVVDPNDLKQDDPEPQSLKPSYVPPLP